jgi:hypothetical protein
MSGIEVAPLLEQKISGCRLISRMSAWRVIAK